MFLLVFFIEDAADGGTCSIDLDYIDPRSEERKQEDEIMREQVQIAKEQRQKQWEDEVRAAKVAGSEEPEKPEELVGSVVPDWGQSPIEVSLEASYLGLRGVGY